MDVIEADNIEQCNKPSFQIEYSSQIKIVVNKDFVL